LLDAEASATAVAAAATAAANLSFASMSFPQGDFVVGFSADRTGSPWRAIEAALRAASNRSVISTSNRA
jgi:hypothetical protein